MINNLFYKEREAKIYNFILLKQEQILIHKKINLKVYKTKKESQMIPFLLQICEKTTYFFSKNLLNSSNVMSVFAKLTLDFNNSTILCSAARSAAFLAPSLFFNMSCT